jgi:hypothetical protein
MGDEEIESWFYCPDCGVYTLRTSRDRFHGEEVVRPGAAIATEKAEQQLAIIRRCEQPWDKRCRCEAHREYFGGWLD